MVTMDESKPRVAAAWFMSDEIADDDPLRDIKYRAAAHAQAAEEMEAAIRHGTAVARADALDQVARLAADGAFTVDEVTDMWERSGLSDEDLDASSYIALILRRVELDGP
jgi:hypothetical protein